jgi:hypothetical protein
MAVKTNELPGTLPQEMMRHTYTESAFWGLGIVRGWPV